MLLTMKNARKSCLMTKKNLAFFYYSEAEILISQTKFKILQAELLAPELCQICFYGYRYQLIN